MSNSPEPSQPAALREGALSSLMVIGLLLYALGVGAGLFAVTHWWSWGQAHGPWVIGGAAIGMAVAAFGLTRSRESAPLVLPFILTSLFVLLRLWVFLPTYPVLFADSPSYLRQPEFRSFQRAFTVPLINTMVLQGGFLKILLFQFLLSLGAWLALALAVYRLVRPGMERWVLPALLLMMGLSHSVVRWDAFILSESVAHSLLILAFAGVLFFHEAFRRTGRLGAPAYGALLALTAIVFLWMNARDAALYMLPVGMAFFALYAWKYRLPRAFTVVVVLLFMGLAGVQNQLMTSSHRWVDPIANVIFRRVLPEADRTAYFVERGMPDDAQLRAFTGRFWWQIGYKKHTEFYAWVKAQGKPTYMGYILHHFPEVNREMIEALPATFTLADFKRKWLHDEVGELFDRLSHDLNRIFFFKLPSVWFVPLWAALAVVMCLLPVPGARSIAVLTVFLGAAAYTQVFIGFHGDAADEGRHTILGQLLFRLSLLSGGLFFWRAARAWGKREPLKD